MGKNFILQKCIIIYIKIYVPVYLYLLVVSTNNSYTSLSKYMYLSPIIVLTHWSSQNSSSMKDVLWSTKLTIEIYMLILFSYSVTYTCISFTVAAFIKWDNTCYSLLRAMKFMHSTKLNVNYLLTAVVIQ